MKDRFGGRRALAGLAALLVCASLAPFATAQDKLAIRVGRIITGVSDDIVDGTILIEQGKIVAIGKDIEVPFDAEVSQFPDGVAAPGFVEPHTQAGLRVSNENVPVVPYITVLDGIDPRDRDFENLLRQGVTTVHVIQGNRTRIGGQGAVVRPSGGTVAAMLIKAPSALKLSLSPGYGQTRMAHMAALRRDFLALRDYLEGLIEKEPGEVLPETGTAVTDLTGLVRAAPEWSKLPFDKIDADRIERQRRPFVDLVRGKIGAFVYCPTATDIVKAFELMDTQGIHGTLVLGEDAHEAAELLASREELGTVVLDGSLEDVEVHPVTGKETRHATGKILHDAGVSFAVQSATSRSTFSVAGSYHPWYQAATLVKQGVPRLEAIRAVTLNAARVLGLDHRLGSLEKGKDANVTIFSGDIFDARSWVDRVYVEGRKVYSRADDHELQELLRAGEQDF